MLVQRGTLRVGDAIVAGDAWGKVRALHTYRGEKVERGAAGRSGRDHRLRQAARGRRARARRRERPPGTASRPGPRRALAARAVRAAPAVAASRSTRSSREMQEGAVQDLNLVIKADVDGSVEAAVSELQKIQHPEVRVNVIHTGVGGISENDVMLATASNAMIVGFNVRPNAEARGAGRARGRRDPHLRRHLPADRGDRAGARRHAEAGHDRGDARRGRGARAVQGLAAGDDRRLHGHERRHAPRRQGARRPRRGGRPGQRRSPSSSASRTTSARSRRASSAASCSTASTT